MLADHINPNWLRVFAVVYRSLSMTQAAKELALTQSGVSQHIKSLEDSLQCVLFDRIQKRVVPTADAHTLFQRVEASLRELETGLAAIKNAGQGLMGELKIAAPSEFCNYVLIPQISEFAKKHPNVGFSFIHAYASDVNALLLDGAVDIAFVDQVSLDPKIKKEPVAEEGWELCIMCEDPTEIPKHRRAVYESLQYVEYAKGEKILKKWFNHHLGKDNLKFNVRAYSEDTRSVMSLILAGYGAGVLPTPLVRSLKERYPALRSLEGCGMPLRNTILMAHLQGRTLSPAAYELMAFIRNNQRGAAQSQADTAVRSGYELTS